VQKIKGREFEFSTDKIAFVHFDEGMHLLLILLEPLLTNEDNQRIFGGLGGIDHLVSVIFA
jgi:hypothetical protein